MILGRLSRAKENAVRGLYGLPPLVPWYRECYVNSMKMLRECLCQAFCPCCVKQGRGRRLRLPTCCGLSCLGGPYQKEVIGNIAGFLAGGMLSLVLYFVMVTQMLHPPLTAFIVCVVAGPFLALGLAFSATLRCLILLMVPQFFTGKGRSFLLVYAMILVMNYPMKNFDRNIIVMSESSTCGQQMAYNQTKELVDAALAPMAGMIDSVRLVLDSVRQFANKLRQAFIALKKAIEEIAATIGRVFSWLGNIVSQCNETMGHPYRKCMRLFDDASRDCRSRLGWFLGWVCGIVDAASGLCHIARIGELLCMITEAIKYLIESEIGKRVSGAIYDIYEMFYFDINLHYHYSLNMTQTKSYGQVKEDIITDIKTRLESFHRAMEYVQDILLITVTFVVVKAVLYRHKFLTKDGFDNVYISMRVKEIDERRCELGRESIFPLTGKEAGRYIDTGSRKMVRGEKKKLARGFILLVISGCHSGFYIMCDYGLYWILYLVAKHFRVTTHVQVPPHLKLHVQGRGALADMYRALIGMFDPLAESNVKMDTTMCLPRPYRPNFEVYETIGVIFLICFLLTTFEAYGLRLRHIIAGCYYPQRERQRAVWLYNHILKNRGSFLKDTRRQIRRKYLGYKEEKTISLKSKLAARYPIARSILKFFGYDRKACLVCCQEGKKENHVDFTHCVNTDCNAVYCNDCFIDINNMCTVCMNPVDYGDISDFSEERDSSEEEENLKKKISSIRRKKLRQKEQEKRRPSQQMHAFRNMLGMKISRSAPDIENEALLSRSDSSPDHSDSECSTHSGSGSDYGYQFRGKDTTASELSEENTPPPRASSIDLVSGDIFDDTSESEFSSDESDCDPEEPSWQEMDRDECDETDIEALLKRKRL
ncbi:hypothetical protein ScPMuIL_002674 [Solemya velum]